MSGNMTMRAIKKTSGRPVKVKMSTKIPVFESGASPSGVEEPTMMEIRSMLIIRLIIKSHLL
jgi:hypothetical protein